MDESKRDPREDISLIRKMLERAMDGMKTVAPWFTGFGIVWVIYGAFSALQRLAMMRASLAAASRLSRVSAIMGYLSCIVLTVGFLTCRSRLNHLGVDSLARKLINTWGVCIFMFLIPTVLLVPVIQILSVYMGFSEEAASALYKACALCRSFLFFLFPAAPLLITAEFLDNRKMLLAGIFLALLAAMVMCCHALMLFGENPDVSKGWWYFWFGASCVLDLAPGVILLVFGRQLKGR